MKKRKSNSSRISVIIYWLIFIALLGLFFTNDFGLVDIHKTSIITAIGIDYENDEVQVTAEVAVPQPSQSGEAIKYTQIQGSGNTIADCMNEINAKTGFYPKLQFTKMILIGDGCTERPLFQVLGCLYRKNYSELTSTVAMCKGKASDMFKMKSEVTEPTSDAILKVLSDELEKSANAASSNLKSIAVSEFSESGACYMPYVEVNEPGTSEGGGDGDNVGGNPSGGSQGGSQGGGGGSQGGSESGGEGGGSGGGSGEASKASQPPVEFTARKTAYFSHGVFKGILDDQQSFALAVLENEIRLAVLPCDVDGIHYTIGLKNVSGGANLKVKDGVPTLTVSFSANAQIQGAKVIVDPAKTIYDDVVSAKILQGAEETLKERFNGLLETLKEANCDLLGLREQLYEKSGKYYEAYKDDILSRAEVKYDLKIKSAT